MSGPANFAPANTTTTITSGAATSTTIEATTTTMAGAASVQADNIPPAPPLPPLTRWHEAHQQRQLAAYIHAAEESAVAAREQGEMMFFGPMEGEGLDEPPLPLPKRCEAMKLGCGGSYHLRGDLGEVTRSGCLLCSWVNKHR